MHRDDYSGIPKNVYEGMRVLCYKPEDMAKACGVSRSTWFNWMKDPGTMQVQYLAIIAAKLCTTPGKLLKDGVM